MKLVHCLAVLACIFGLFLGQAAAQITLTQADVQSAILNVQYTSYSRQYNPGKSINLGDASGGQTFDFSNITAPDTLRDTVVTNYRSPSGLPGADMFPSASAADRKDYSSGGATITLVSYFSIDPDGFYLLGISQHVQIPPFIDTISTFAYRPKSLSFPTPFTNGDSRTSTDTIDNGATENITTHSVFAQGYGTLILPNAKSNQALRLIADNTTTTYQNGTFASRTRTRTVAFYMKDGSTAAFEVADTAYTSGNAMATRFVYSVKTGAALDVRQTPSGVPGEFHLAQNYPNPFNPSTQISYTISSAEFVSLRVYDLLGREVATLVTGRQPAGTHQVRFEAGNLPGGVYFYRLEAGQSADRKKMLLLK